MEPWLIGYIVFQIIVWVLTILVVEGEKINKGLHYKSENFLIFLITTIPALNIITFVCLVSGSDKYYMELGFNKHKDIFHYLILALPVLALVSLFFVEI